MKVLPINANRFSCSKKATVPVFKGSLLLIAFCGKLTVRSRHKRLESEHKNKFVYVLISFGFCPELAEMPSNYKTTRIVLSNERNFGIFIESFSAKSTLDMYGAEHEQSK